MTFLFLVVGIIVLFYVMNIKNIEHFKINNNYICFACVNLTPELLETSKNMLKYGYKVFMVDNNTTKHPNEIEGINILQIDDNKCIKLGYKNASKTLKKTQLPG